MAEDDALEDRSTHPNHYWYGFVELAALVRVGRLGAVGLRRANHAVELLEGGRRFFLRQLHTADDDHALPSVILESEFELGLDFTYARHLRVVHERFTTR